MYLEGRFKDKKNNSIIVEITDGDDAQKTVIGQDGLFFTDDPVIIEQENDDTFEEIITKSATISLYTKDYLGGQLFADNSRSITVSITKNGQNIFSGYVEPSTFTQPFTSPLDEFSINCIDRLATLKYYNYGEITLKNYKEKKAAASTTSFKSILKNALSPLLKNDITHDRAGKIFYDHSKKLTKEDKDDIFTSLGISEQLMIGDDFDDVWTYEETLREILKYLNLHIIQHGIDFYIFDWEKIRNGSTVWVDILYGDTQIFTDYQNHILSSDMHADNDTSITVNDVYNQIQVKCKLEKQEDIIESPLENSSLVSPYFCKQKYMTEIISEGDGGDAYDGFRNMVIGQTTTYKQAKKIDWYLQYMLNNNWKIKTFNGQTFNDVSATYTDENGTFINQHQLPKFVKDNSLSSCIFKMGSVEKKDESQDNSPISKIDMNSYLFISVNGNDIDGETTSKPSENDIQNHTNMIEYVGNNSGGVYSPTDNEITNYLVFSGKVLLQPTTKETAQYDECYKAFMSSNYMKYWKQTVPSENNGNGRYYTRVFYKQKYPKNEPTDHLQSISLQPWAKDKANHLLKYHYTAKNDSTDKYCKLPIFECELIIGNKRLIESNIDQYGNSTFQWVEIGKEPKVTDADGIEYTLTTFTLGVNPKIGDYIIGNEYTLQNNIDYTMGLNAEGTAIPIKKSDKLTGAVIFRILGPVNTTWNDITKRHRTFFRREKWKDNDKVVLAHVENIILKDFQCKIYTDGGGYESDGEKDLIYLSTETDKYINKKDDIEFKIITQLSSSECREKGLNNTVNLNAVINLKDNGPLRNIYNNVTDESAKPEEHYINQYYNEFSTPKINMETTLHNENLTWFDHFHSNPLNRDFFVMKSTENVKQATSTILLKEK